VYKRQENLLPENKSISLSPNTITLSGIAFESRIAQLTWTTTDPALQGTYYIEREVDASGIFTLIQQLPFTVLHFEDTISYPFCDSLRNFNYRVSFIETLTGDTTISNILPLILQDITAPVNVTNLIVSITPPRFPVITWDKVTGDDIFGYDIQRYNYSWPTITTVPADSNSFIDKSVNACDSIYTYAIRTLDRCKIPSTPDYELRQTIKLDLPQIKPCERLAKLSWNPYNFMPGGLGGYKIFLRIDAGSPVEIADLTDTTVNSYVNAYPFENGRNYYYQVQAYSATGIGVSSSCEQGYLFTGYAIPDSIYLTEVSVVSDKYVSVKFHSLPDSTVKKVILERSVDGGASFQAIDSISVQGDFVEQDGIMNDTTADVHSQSYTYRVIAVDYCGTNLIYSNSSKSIFLQCSSTPDQNTLEWNAYESWLEDVEGYKVYRTVQGQPVAGEMIQNVSSATLTYPDLASDVDPTKQACYWIVASEKPGNPYLTNSTSVSNTCCIIKGATLFMPNAFRPGGKNDRFRPVATYVDPQSFTMTIFSRWGQELFKTSDIVNGWDGLINGQYAPPGLYAYVLSYKSVGGKEYAKRGTVIVVR
jgi:gliding motility-associated-like protein